MIRNREKIGDAVFLDFQIGNTYAEVPEEKIKVIDGNECRHSWTLFLRIKNKQMRSGIVHLIEKVKIGWWAVDFIQMIPHGAAYNNYGLEVRGSGWGTFDTPMTIYWKHGVSREKTTTVDWHLDFSS